jgi:hypothetical protein
MRVSLTRAVAVAAIAPAAVLPLASWLQVVRHLRGAVTSGQAGGGR